MEKRPFFSVIVLAYQVEEYIEKCLDSIIGQTFQDYEVIVVNPYGADKTDKICRRYQQQYSSIRIIRKENEGQLLNRISGFRQAEGKYLLCIDGDDWWLPSALEEIYTALKENPCELLIFNYQRVSNGEVKINGGILKENTFLSGNEKKVLYEKLIQEDPAVNAMWTKVIARSVFSRITEEFVQYKSMRRAEDLLQSLYIMDEAKTVFYLNRSLYCYRKRKGSMIQTFRSEDIDDMISVTKCTEIYMEKWGMDTQYFYEMLYISAAKFFMDFLYRCCMADLSFGEREKVLKKVRETPLYQKSVKYQKNVEMPLKYRLPAELFQINQVLTLICGFFYRIGRKCKNRQILFV